MVLCFDNVLLKCTGATLLAMPLPCDMYNVFPTLYSLLESVDHVGCQLRHNHRNTGSAVWTSVAGRVPRKDIRPPVDMSRPRVCGQPLNAFLMYQLVVGAKRELAQLLHMLGEV